MHIQLYRLMFPQVLMIYNICSALMIGEVYLFTINYITNHINNCIGTVYMYMYHYSQIEFVDKCYKCYQICFPYTSNSPTLAINIFRLKKAVALKFGQL